MTKQVAASLAAMTRLYCVHCKQVSTCVQFLHAVCDCASDVVNFLLQVGVVRQMETAAIKASGSNKYTPFTRKLTAVYTRATLEVSKPPVWCIDFLVLKEQAFINLSCTMLPHVQVFLMLHIPGLC